MSPDFRNSLHKRPTNSVDRLILLQSIQALAKSRQDKEHTIFTWKTSNPTEVKKTTTYLCRIFIQSTKWAKMLQSDTRYYKVTHTRPTSLGHNVLVPLDLDTLHSLLTKEMKRSPYFNASQISYCKVQRNPRMPI